MKYLIKESRVEKIIYEFLTEYLGTDYTVELDFRIKFKFGNHVFKVKNKDNNKFVLYINEKLFINIANLFSLNVFVSEKDTKLLTDIFIKWFNNHQGTYYFDNDVEVLFS